MSAENHTTPVFITLRDISRRIPVSEKTLRNKSSLGTLPFPSVMLMGKRAVRLSDFENYLKSLSSPAPQAQPVVTLLPVKKRGRPSNAQRARLAEQDDFSSSELVTVTELNHVP